MLTIHGRATSSNVQAVTWLAAELGLDFRRLDVGGAFGGNQAPSFLAMNPMGRVPVLQDAEVTMFESQAILRYLAGRYGERFWPCDPVHRAPIDQWMEWAKGSVVPVLIYKVFWQLVRTSAAERDQNTLQGAVEDLKSLMAISEAQISKFGWLAGPDMSLADFSFGTQLYRYFTVPFERAELPHLKDYYARLTDRPAYAEHVMVSYESLRVH